MSQKYRIITKEELQELPEKSRVFWTSNMDHLHGEAVSSNTYKLTRDYHIALFKTHAIYPEFVKEILFNEEGPSEEEKIRTWIDEIQHYLNLLKEKLL